MKLPKIMKLPRIFNRSSAAVPPWEVNGVDVSEYQGEIDFDKMFTNDVSFVYFRAAKGLRTDAYYHRNKAELAKRNKLHGTYGVLFAQYNNAIEQANAFVGLIAGNMPPVVDLERPSPGTAYPKSVIQKAVADYIHQIEVRTGEKVVIYTSAGWWNYWMYGIKFPNALWVANYTTYYKPVLPVGWSTWEFWQWSADGNHEGAKYGCESDSIDKDRYNGTMEDFLREYKGEVPIPPPDPPIIPEKILITSGVLSVRSSPSTETGTLFGKASRGAVAKCSNVIENESGTWYEVKVYVNKMGAKPKE